MLSLVGFDWSSQLFEGLLGHLIVIFFLPAFANVDEGEALIPLEDLTLHFHDIRHLLSLLVRFGTVLLLSAGLELSGVVGAAHPKKRLFHWLSTLLNPGLLIFADAIIHSWLSSRLESLS